MCSHVTIVPPLRAILESPDLRLDARAGEIVVAMIEGEATVKRYFPEGNRIRFQPANARMEPIFVSKSSFKQTDVLGIVVGVYRKV